MIKAVNGVSSWFIFDSMRDPHNPVNHTLYSDVTNDEDIGTGTLWFKASGFRFKSNTSNLNVGGRQYMWAAFAEHPFTGSEIAPPTAF